MNLNDAPPGYAFQGDYPEIYREPRQVLQQILQRQIGELDRTRSHPDALMGILRGRRGGREDLSQLELRRRNEGFDCLLARGEVVMDTKWSKDPRVDNLMTSQGFSRQPCQHADLVRWRRSTLFRTSVDRLHDQCCTLGADTWQNYVATMAAVGKGIGGPEPVSGPPTTFSEYRTSFGLDQTTASGPLVAVIDTGIPSLDEDRHPGMRRTDGWLHDVQRTDDNRDLLDDFPCGPDGYLDFQAGHGTFVTGIIQRVAPGADIRVYRAADSDGFATDDEIADAMLRAFKDGAQIINLSLGARTADDQPPRAMAAAVANIRRKGDGVVIVAAAGNFGDHFPCWPAALDGVEAVAGLTADLKPARWSSHGFHVRFSTVAEGIRSTFVTGREAPVFDREPEEFPQDAWAVWSGTSFAAPQIAGAVARICQKFGLSPRKAVDKLHERGEPINCYGRAMKVLEGIR